MQEFNNWKQQEGMKLSTPKFRKYTRSISLSDYAFGELLRVAEELGYVFGNNKPNINELIEAIGLGCLHIEPSQPFAHEGLMSDQCYEDGKNDALEGRAANFELIYGTQKPRQLREAYVRGYYEHLAR